MQRSSAESPPLPAASPAQAQRIAEQLGQRRRALASHSPEIFATTYLTSACSKPFSRMHMEIFTNLKRMSVDRGEYYAIAAPRGNAKSTVVTLAYVLWGMVYQLEPLTIIISNTAEQAGKLVGHIKRELEENSLLRMDFPELVARSSKRAPWRSNQFRLPNQTTVMGFGAGQNLRGTRADNQRPGLIVIDDLEDKNAVVEQDQRDKLSDWVNSTVLRAGHTETNVVAVGTVLHEGSFLARLLDPSKSAGWTAKRYQSVETFADRQDLWRQWELIYTGKVQFKGWTPVKAAEAYFRQHREEMLKGAKVLWPAWESYYDLMVTRERVGRTAFAAEMQNCPVPPGKCLFAEVPLRYWDSKHRDIDALRMAKGPNPGSFFLACDPSMGRPDSDFAALVMVFRPYDSRKRYVIAADILRCHPSGLVPRILAMCDPYPHVTVGVEATGFQQLMIDDLRRQAHNQRQSITIKAIKNTGNKVVRINALEAVIARGELIFDSRHADLLNQLREFPTLKHDDGPDALEMVTTLSDFKGPGLWRMQT